MTTRACAPPLVAVNFSDTLTQQERYHQHRQVCFDDTCCLPCVANSLVGEASVFQEINYVSSASCFVMFILVILLLLFPRIMVRTKYSLGMSISLMFFHMPEVINLFGPMEGTLCTNAVTTATALTNWRCALQGGLVVYGSLSTALWSATRITTLFCALRYRIVLSGSMETLLMVFICSGLPLIQAAFAVGFNIISYQVGHICVPEIGFRGYMILWGPCIAILVPFLCMHIATFHLIAKSLRRDRDFSASTNQRTIGDTSLRSNCGDGGSDAEQERADNLYASGMGDVQHRGRLARLAARRPLDGSLIAFVKLEWRPFASFSVNLLITILFTYVIAWLLDNKHKFDYDVSVWMTCLYTNNYDFSKCTRLATFLKHELRFVANCQLCRAYVGLIIFFLEVSKTFTNFWRRMLELRRCSTAKSANIPLTER